MKTFVTDLSSIEKTFFLILAVCGGFIVGFFATHFGTQLYHTLLRSNKTMGGWIRMLRFAGGGLTAVLVYLWFPDKTGPADDGSRGHPSSSQVAATTSQPEARIELPSSQNKATPSHPDEMRSIVIHLMRYDSPARQFYRWDQESSQIPIEEVVKRLDNSLKLPKESRLRLVRIEADVPDYPAQALSLLIVHLKNRSIEYIPLVPKKP